MCNKNNKPQAKKAGSKNKGTSAAKKGEDTVRILSSCIMFGSFAIFAYFAIDYYWSKPLAMPHPDDKQHWGIYPVTFFPGKSSRPFEIEFSDVIVNDLKERLLHHRKPPLPLEDAGFTYGFNSNFLTKVVDYWRNDYDFKQRESYLNQYMHFRTRIQGLDIHYMRVEPKNPENFAVVPILLLHGWPGSFREFYEMIPLLTKPREGMKFVFEVFVPSLPGFGYSEAAARPGLGPMEMAGIMHNLMIRLGVKHYYVQGGDLGHTVGSIMATLYPDNVLGFHTNFPVLVFNPMAQFWIALGSLWPSLLEPTPELQSRLYPLTDKFKQNVEETGYMHIQATKPDTVGSAVTDSPAGLAAYILEKFSTWTDPANRRAADGGLVASFSLTHLLDNVMLYWATGSATTSMRVYAETMRAESTAMVFDRIPTDVPTWGIKFKHELAYNPDSILKMKYKNYLHSTVVDGGGHFAALENPAIMASDIFEAVATFRKFHGHSDKEVAKKSVYDFTVKDINGNFIKLDKYKGMVMIIVNVASNCFLTDKNYSELNELHEKYHSSGLHILAFPCNQFNGQEPGTADDIIRFTEGKGILFEIFAKIDVNGENADPLWKYLKSQQTGILGSEFIKWNFSKFVVDRNGKTVARLGPNVHPLDLEPYILEEL